MARGTYYAELQVGILNHRRFVGLDPGARGLWAWGLAYCQDQLTDGVIPRAVLPRLLDRPMPTCLKLARLLVERGLWEEHGEDFHVHDYLEHNRSRETVLRERESARQRARKARGGGAESDAERAPHVRGACAASVPDRTVPDRTVPELPPPLSPSRGTRERSTDPPGFQRFWASYPKRVGKGAAATAWMKGQCEGRVEAVLTGLERQQTYLRREGGRFVPLPATWLHQRRWEDTPPDVVRSTGAPSLRARINDAWVGQASGVVDLRKAPVAGEDAQE